MKIVIDTNIVFSALLNPSGLIGQILLYGQRTTTFCAPYLLKEEIRHHKGKILALGNLTEKEFEDIRDMIFSCIYFISEEQIPYECWHRAIPLVRDTDMDDIAFVALTEYLDVMLWTGDKKLLSGLESRGFVRGIDTDRVHTWIQNIENQ